MNLSDIEIEGFGIWNGLELNDLSGEVTVFYGPNETGKTTLLEFVRAVFYGFASARRGRYLPPVRGGRGGGSLLTHNGEGSFRISRFDDESQEEAGTLTITDREGTPHDESLLQSLLGGVDESIYRNVFAVGLEELQYLGTLSGGDAASLLYDLSLGLDRVSLVEVLRELNQSRSRLLSPDDRPSHIAQLLRSRDSLESEIEDLTTDAARFWRLSASKAEVDQEIAQAEAQGLATDRELRLIETAVAVGGRWQERSTIDKQLAAAGDLAQLPIDGVARLGAIQAGLRKRRSRWKQYRQRRLKLHRAVRALQLNEPLWRQAARIEALAENEPWINSLESQVRDSQKEIARLESQLSEEGARLGIGSGPRSADLLKSSSRWLTPLRSAAKAVRQARRAMLDAKAEVTGNRASADALREEIQATLAARADGDLTTALEETGQLVSQLRRRIQLDDRLDQMARNKSELEELIHKSIDREALPGWQLGIMGVAFAVGVLLLFSGVVDWLFPTFLSGNKAWLAVLGILASGGAAAAKWGLERAAARQLDSSQKQLAMLKLQIVQAKEERESLDEQLPSGGGHLVTRLQKAEKELASLEELLPLSAKAQLAEQQSESEQQRLRRAGADFKAARSRWKQALASAGLPENLTPAQLRDLAQHGDMLGELQRKLEEARLHCDAKRKELESVRSRVNGMMSAGGLSDEGDSLAGQLRQLRRAAAEQEALFRKRDELMQRSKKYRRRQRKCRRDILRLMRRRRSLMRAAGAVDQHDFQRRVEQCSQVDALRRRREALQAEIDGALGEFPADLVAQWLADSAGKPEDRLGSLRSRASASANRLRELFERRGDLGAQMKSIIDDRRIEQKRLELAAVTARLKLAIERWQVLATTEGIFADIKRQYETDRQPKALRQASKYLSQLTSGRYRRVWTPLEAGVLRVDDADGQTLPVEVLSRGTREQLFLSLRLALVASYARGGAVLPLVLDDVLVNFDVERAHAAAELLRDFAANGHQLLVFTCHEHIFDMFQSAGADCRLLGDLSDRRTTDRAEQPAAKKKRRTKSPVVESEPTEQAAAGIEATVITYVEQTQLEPNQIDVMQPRMELASVDDTPQPVQMFEEPEAATPAAERPRRLARKARRPKAAATAPRWAAEEFDGELADRVSKHWREVQTDTAWPGDTEQSARDRAADEESEAA